MVGVLSEQILHVAGLDLQLRRRREALHKDRVVPEILWIDEREIIRRYPQGEPARGLFQLPQLVLPERYAEQPLER